MFNINHKENRKKCKLGRETKLSFPELEECKLVNCIPEVIILPLWTPGRIFVLRISLKDFPENRGFIYKMAQETH